MSKKKILAVIMILFAVVPVIITSVAWYRQNTYREEIAKTEDTIKKDREEISGLEEEYRELVKNNSDNTNVLSEWIEKQVNEQTSIGENKAAIDLLTVSLEENNIKAAGYRTNTETLLPEIADLEARKADVSAQVSRQVKSCRSLQEQIDALIDEMTPKEEKPAETPKFPQNPSFIDPEGKTAYLTFDDGPSKYTPQVLDILKKYNIKATFFVTYKSASNLIPYYSRIVDEGHTIAIHTASHEYKQVYANFDAWKADYDKIWNYVKKLTGVECQLYRFPGGSINSYNKNVRNSIRDYLNKNNIIYYDWNVANGDGGHVTASEAYHNVVDNIGSRKKAIILMHDATGKQTTVDSLPGIIEALLNKGYQFDRLDATVAPVQMAWK